MLMWDIDCSPGSTGLMSGSDACLVFINAFASEGWDRPGIHDNYSDELVNRVANSCANTVVVIHNAGIRLVDQFVNHPNVTAIIFAHLPGQDSGRALVSLLYGDNNFSGKLPYTVAKNDTDYPVLHHTEAVTPYGLFPQSNFTEGVCIDYRAFDAENITPQYEFGFGLSYTSFSFSDLSISNSSPHKSFAEYPSGAIEQGGAIDLWDTIATDTGGHVKQLRGFEKIQIASGGSATVEFPLTRRDLSTWDVVAQKWLLQRGRYKKALTCMNIEQRYEEGKFYQPLQPGYFKFNGTLVPIRSVESHGAR
ncbi:putative glycoside hydrolase family 3 protein [Lipomyces orientalis]|uniref:Glycoside hydrolase family 3 protein n=1 Tax=Lipomyces orientalis TaxID=1233043 RepID=A0ACC3TKN6_9ASCO